MANEPDAPDFDVVIVGQRGRLAAEAVLFAASLRANDPGFSGQLIVAEPQHSPLWPEDPRLPEEVLAALTDLGAEILPFETHAFGAAYPNGNKAEALAAMAPGRPFLFFDTDTLVTGALSALPFDFSRPAASMRRTATWPVIEPYGPGYAETWGALYDRFGLDFASSQNSAWPERHWERYLYFNAGWFFGPDAAGFGHRLTDIMTAIRDDPPEALVCQPLYPWLDQIALPLVIHGFGGGRPGPELEGLDGGVTWHYRALPVLYLQAEDATLARFEEITAPNRIKKAIKLYDPWKRWIYQGRGRRLRQEMGNDLADLSDQQFRNRLKRAGHWIR